MVDLGRGLIIENARIDREIRRECDVWDHAARGNGERFHAATSRSAPSFMNPDVTEHYPRLAWCFCELVDSTMAMRKRILFVDDDPQLLVGLRNLLHRDRRRWEMVFVNGGETALRELQAMPFDVIVSDLRMPGIDGAALLEKVRTSSPATIRIMLSGSADEDEIERAMPAVDLLLSKPCETRILREAIERAIDGSLVSRSA
jgi:CheY-like chemotaxis protein